MKFPKVIDPNKVGEYETLVNTGAGFFYDQVLEYRVWCYPSKGAEDFFEGDDYFYPFENYEDALIFSQKESGREKPIALIKQFEWINEIEPGIYLHEKGERITEWIADELIGRKRELNSIKNKLLDLQA
ncbi:hypothetical protein [Flavobacterium sp. 3HN19-14]|uniref:hypothetical protein n=1 Tax=Flavobacterium sp. 3HN19-14 TaxID=3448133 RepID=UPI003EE1B20A